MTKEQYLNTVGELQDTCSYLLSFNIIGNLRVSLYYLLHIPLAYLSFFILNYSLFEVAREGYKLLIYYIIPPIALTFLIVFTGNFLFFIGHYIHFIRLKLFIIFYQIRVKAK